MGEVARAVERLLPGVTVQSTEPLSGGASASLTAVHATDEHGEPLELVLRQGSHSSVPLTIGTRLEAAAMDEARAAGAHVPGVLVAFDADPVLGDGYLMTREVGETLPKRILRESASASDRWLLLRSAAHELASIHAVDTVEGLPELSASVQLDLLEATHVSFGQSVPTFALVIDWLRDNVPNTSRVGLVHGDFRMGNLVVAASRVVAVLDWELAHLGDPHEDLGWFCAPAWRFGGPGPAAGLGSREELWSAYGERFRMPFDPAAAHFWEVLATLKWGVICQYQASRHLSGKERSVELAAIGRRVTEVELDLLLLIDGSEAPFNHTSTTEVSPTAQELAAAAADYLEHDATDASDYQRKVAVNALRIVERELVQGPDVPPVVDGDLDSLRRNVMARLAIDNPDYPALAEARDRWGGP